MKKILIITSFIVCGVLVFLIAKTLKDRPSPEDPIYLSEVTENEPDIQQWRKIWSKENNIKKVAVIRDDPDLLEVRVDYTYSGNEGDEIYTCGAIDQRKNHVNWSCKPSKITAGDGFAILSFQTNKNSNEVECSMYVVVSLYPGGGSPIYHSYFRYEKVWLKDKSGIINILKQKMYDCDN